MITKATYKFEYYVTIKSNLNIFTHIDKTNAVKNEIYKFTLPHRYILNPTSFQMKFGKLHSRKFANAYRILDVFFKMLPTCFMFDNIHTMKFQQLYIGRASTRSNIRSNRASTPFIIVLPKIRRKSSIDLLFVIPIRSVYKNGKTVKAAV